MQPSLCRMALNLADASCEGHHRNDAVLSALNGGLPFQHILPESFGWVVIAISPFVFNSYFVGRYSKITIVPVLVRPPSTNLSHQ